MKTYIFTIHADNDVTLEIQAGSDAEAVRKFCNHYVGNYLVSVLCTYEEIE